jgi:hypothetical protein
MKQRIRYDSFRYYSIYNIVDTIHKKMYGTVTKLTIIEVIKIMSEHFVYQLKKDGQLEIDKFIRFKITNVSKWNGATKKKVKAKLYKSFGNLLLENPLLRSNEEMSLLAERRRVRIEKARAWQELQIKWKNENQAAWISKRTKRKNVEDAP